MKKLRILFIILGVLAAIVLPAILMPMAGIPVAMPHIQMPAEKVFLDPLFTLFGVNFYLYNTIPAVILADIILLILLPLAGRRAKRKLELYETNPQAVDTETGEDILVPNGLLNGVETIFEYIYGLVNNIAGEKHARSIFNVVMTIFIFVLTLNMLHFLPGVDSVGILHCAEPGVTKGFLAEEIGHTGMYKLAFNDEISGTGIVPPYDAEVCEAAHHAAHADDAEHGDDHAEEGESTEILYTLAPFMRTGSSDISLTAAIAVLAMISVQYFGVKELGFGYFSKFFNFKALKKGALGAIEFIVGLLELVSEFSKIVSFSLRLFGNIFAGSILLFVMLFLVPVGVPLVFFLLEIIIGLVQALVFALLTLVLISLAMLGHGDHDDHAEEHAH